MATPGLSDAIVEGLLRTALYLSPLFIIGVGAWLWWKRRH